MQIYLTWIHILFFATWLGTNLFCLVIFLPATASLPLGARSQARRRASQGVNIVAAVSAPLVVLSGSAWLFLPEPAAAARGYSLLLAGKAVLTLAMILNHLLQAFKYMPGPARGRHAGPAPAEAAWRNWVRLLTLNVILGLTVFFLGLFPVSR